MEEKKNKRSRGGNTHSIDLILPLRYPLSRSILGGSFDEVYYGNEDDGRKTGPSAMKKKRKIGTVGGKGEERERKGRSGAADTRCKVYEVKVPIKTADSTRASYSHSYLRS